MLCRLECGALASVGVTKHHSDDIQSLLSGQGHSIMTSSYLAGNHFGKQCMLHIHLFSYQCILSSLVLNQCWLFPKPIRKIKWLQLNVCVCVYTCMCVCVCVCVYVCVFNSDVSEWVICEVWIPHAESSSWSPA